MPGETSSGSGKELDDFVRAYAATWASVDPANLKTLLPEPGHPLYVAVLREVVCADPPVPLGSRSTTAAGRLPQFVSRAFQ